MSIGSARRDVGEERGGPHGSINENLFFNNVPEALEDPTHEAVVAGPDDARIARRGDATVVRRGQDERGRRGVQVDRERSLP